MNRLALFASLAIIAQPSHAGDSLKTVRQDALRQVVTDRCVATSFQKMAWENAALVSLTQRPSLSVVSVGGSIAPAAEARMVQLGTGGRQMHIAARSLQRIDRHTTVWGEASYETGKTYDVRWCETSDFLLLYPYLMADGRGGDLKREVYRLSGSWAGWYGHMHYGAKLGYRALSEYRDHDPRPNNTVADLWAQVSAGRDFAGHTLALALDGGKYKQTNELAYYNELGAQKEFQLTGLGNDFSRFSGASNNVFFKGYDFGGSLNLMRQDAHGIAASVAYRHKHRQKVLTDLNRLPLNDLTDQRWQGELAYVAPGGESQGAARGGLRLNGTLTHRQGDDNLFGEPTGNVYPQIGSRRQFKGDHSHTRMEAFGIRPFGDHWVLTATAHAAYDALRLKHEGSGNRLDADNLLGGITAEALWHGEARQLSLRAAYDHRAPVSDKLAIQASADEGLQAATAYAHHYLASSADRLAIALRYDLTLWAGKVLSVETGWHHDRYLGSHHANKWEARVALTL